MIDLPGAIRSGFLVPPVLTTPLEEKLATSSSVMAVVFLVSVAPTRLNPCAVERFVQIEGHRNLTVNLPVPNRLDRIAVTPSWAACRQRRHSHRRRPTRQFHRLGLTPALRR
jgi:hypothetical protein